MITYNNFMYVLPGFVLEKPFRDPKAVLLHEAIHVPRLRKAQLISHCKLAYMQLLDGLSCVGMGIARSRSHPDRQRYRANATHDMLRHMSLWAVLMH